MNNMITITQPSDGKVIAVIHTDGSFSMTNVVPDWVFEFITYRRAGGQKSLEDWMSQNGAEIKEQVENSLLTS